MAETGAWMPMYWADYFGDTMHLNTVEHGAYLLLIGTYWRRGKALPDDDRWLANVTKMSPKKWQKVRPKVSEFFSQKDDLLHHKRLDKEILKSSDRLKSARASGKAGGLAKAKLVTVTATVERKQAVEAAAPKAEEAKIIGMECLRILGKVDDLKWQFGIVDQWIAAGHSAERIYAVLKECVANGSAAKANSMKYFTPIMADPARGGNGAATEHRGHEWITPPTRAEMRKAWAGAQAINAARGIVSGMTFEQVYGED